jgi:hypothetical protein
MIRCPPMRERQFTALDGIAVFLTGLLAAFLVAFAFVIAPRFQAMFSDFGAKDALPPLTRLTLSRWFPLALGASTAAGPVLALMPSIPMVQRRWFLVAAFVFGFAAIGTCWVGMYQPIFDLAVKIEAE